MAIIISESTDPFYNLALEEYFLKTNKIAEDIFFLWQSNQAFIIGRNQNPFTEINHIYFNKNIPIVRRISGGGTIFEDKNTINFTYITKDYISKINDYFYFVEPVIKVLNNCGVKAKFVPRTNIFVDKKKISGNAQAFVNNKLMHHGTILFDTDLTVINEALLEFDGGDIGEHIGSNKNLVTNISNILNPLISLNDLKDLILKEVIASRNISDTEYVLDSKDIEQIKDIAENKYKTWDWNFGKTKLFNTTINVNSTLLNLTIDKGKIMSVDQSKFNKLIGVKFLTEEYFRIIDKYE
ncbi:MAG: biotin/lipoate A/B protein ligase family protein [Candidatus Izemoplasmatales bacterium]